MHLPMRCNYWEAAERLPTLAPRKSQQTQSSWASGASVGEEKKVDVASNEKKPPPTTTKNVTQSSYASVPKDQSMDDLEWDQWQPMPSGRKHPLSERTKGSQGSRSWFQCTRQRCCCCGVACSALVDFKG